MTTTFYIVVAILGASNGYRLTPRGRHATAQEACEYAATGNTKQVIAVEFIQKESITQCCEREWGAVSRSAVNRCVNGEHFYADAYCDPPPSVIGSVTIMDCIAAPSYRAVPSTEGNRFNEAGKKALEKTEKKP